MLQWFFFGIISLVIAALSLILWKFQKQNSSNLEILSRMSRDQNLLAMNMMNRQLEMNQTLTNLLLSKDPMTFQGLQAMSNQNPTQSQSGELVNPMDDASVAHQLAEQYKRHGLDPQFAYAQDDDVDWNAEFGLG